MRKLIDILNTLEEPFKNQILENIFDQMRTDSLQKDQFDSVKEAVVESFVWNKSKEGFDYWYDYFTTLKNE